MAKASTRQELIDYCLRQLGAPVLEVNVDDDQIDDLIDDAIQMFHERIFDGVEKMYLKYKITQDDIDRGLGVTVSGTTTGIGGTTGIGIHTTGITTSMVNTGIATYGERKYDFYENSNYIQVPDSVMGIEKIFKFDSSSISGGMFSIKYQLFLNDLYYFNSVELLQYSMTKTRLEDIDFLLSPEKQIRFNKRQDRLYLDLDWGSQTVGDFLIIDCYRALNPDIFKIKNFEYINQYDFIPHLTLDTKEDFQFISTIFEHFYSKQDFDFSIEDVMNFIDLNKDLLQLNNLIERKWKQYRDD